MSTIEKLISTDAYSLTPEQKSGLFLEAMNEAYEHHYNSCSAYAHYCQKRGFNQHSRFERIEDIPYLPVEAFKENADLLLSVTPDSIKTKLSSSATSGVPSTVLIDKVTSKRQIKALANVMSATMGGTRRPFLILDSDPTIVGAAGLTARHVAVRGFLNLARESNYFMHAHTPDQLELQMDRFEAALGEYAAKGEPVVIFGFTFVLYLYVVRQMLDSGRKVSLPKGSLIAHIGGWKKLESQKIDKTQFNKETASAFDVRPSDVIDFYGFTEQMGVVYPDSAALTKCTPAFSEVIVRDPETFSPLPDGQEGLLEFITPLPNSYPGIAVLTDDVGKVVARGKDEQNRVGTHFVVTGRAKKAEVRGCGDIMSEKVVRDVISKVEWSQREKVPARLLFGSSTNYCGNDLEQSVNVSKLPEVDSIAALAERLKTNANALKKYSVDELVLIISKACERWTAPESKLQLFRNQGLMFLASWCQPATLRRTMDNALDGRRGYLDRFQPEETRLRMKKAVPKGLVGHWLSGNVPLLGMLTLVQSICTRNANILKASATFSSMLPALLEEMAKVEVKVSNNRILYGSDITDTIAVVYYDRFNEPVAAEFSEQLDARMAWGGREAVEAVTRLPKKFDCEDIIFGPKLSFMVIGKELLSNERHAKRTARRAAVDCSVFDQYACASPHTIYVERGGSFASPRQFCDLLATEMQKAMIRIPKQPVDAATNSAVKRARMRHEFIGEVISSNDTSWTILFSEEAAPLGKPIYSRVITVRAIDDVNQAIEYAHQDIQTIGIGLNGARRLEFAELAAEKGISRMPELGRMTYFDSPWDGMYPASKLVNWVSLGGPF